MFRIDTSYMEMESFHTARIERYGHDHNGNPTYKMVWDNAIVEGTGSLKEVRAMMEAAGMIEG